MESEEHMLLEISLSFEKTSIIDSLQGTPIILLNKPFSAQEFSITLSQQTDFSNAFIVTWFWYFTCAPNESNIRSFNAYVHKI